MLWTLAVAGLVTWACVRLYRAHYPANYAAVIAIPHDPFLPVIGTNVPQGLSEMRKFLVREWAEHGSPVLHKCFVP